MSKTAAVDKKFLLCRLAVIGIVIGGVCLMAEAAGKIYYVHPQGNDRNIGDKDNPLQSIQAAINRANNGEPNNYDIVRVKKGVYVTEPIYFNHNNQGLFIEEGSEIIAKSNNGLDNNGPFSASDAALFKIKDKNNISIRAYGVTLKMQKEEYKKLPGEWRSCLILMGCSNIELYGCTLKDSGGDGIDIGPGSFRTYCQNILIKEVTCDNNTRNAISVISVDGLKIENCVLKNTDGKKPGAGIDFEPNKFIERLNKIVIKNTTIFGNAGYAIVIQPVMLRTKTKGDETKYIDILFENVTVKNGQGVYVAYFGDDGPDGSILFKNMKVENTSFGTWIGKSSKKLALTFENCIWKDIDKDDYPIKIFSNGEITDWPGGVRFIDCQVFDDQDRPAIKYMNYAPLKDTLYEIHGNLYVSNTKRKASLYDWQGAKLVNGDLAVNQGIADFVKADDPNNKD